MSAAEVKRSIRRLADARVWRPSRAALLFRSHAARQPRDEEIDLRVHLLAAVDWLERCHDASVDGGLPGRYRLNGGWTSSYPETTGYAIPTLLRLADGLPRAHLLSRVEACVAFLTARQLDVGAFPGGEVGAAGEASVFNSAQVLAGLDAWDAAQDDAKVRDSAAQAADWLVRVQHDDGAWRDFTYGGLACSYYAHASCWLARFGVRVDEPRYTDASARHVAWVLRQQDPDTGWFENAGFPRDHRVRVADTHTLGYTLWGLLVSSEALGLPEASAAARKAAEQIAARQAQDGWLPGKLGYDWEGRARYACLTGNAQLAQVWTRLAREGDPGARLRVAAQESLRLIAQAQPLSSHEAGVRGGVPGSSPISGDYLPAAFPSWAAKFLADAILDFAEI